jgi:hypothetical protein
MASRSQLAWRAGGLSGALALGGCAEPASNAVEAQAPSSTVDRMSVVQAARMTQSGEPGSQVGQGGGNSMQPIYGDNTVLVIEPIAWDQLRAGMNVAYRDPFGNRIVHRLLYKQDGYWVAQGLNNPGPDKYPVMPKNLIGVVYGSFQTDAPAETAQ